MSLGRITVELLFVYGGGLYLAQRGRSGTLGTARCYLVLALLHLIEHWQIISTSQFLSFFKVKGGISYFLWVFQIFTFYDLCRASGNKGWVFQIAKIYLYVRQSLFLSNWMDIFIPYIMHISAFWNSTKFNFCLMTQVIIMNCDVILKCPEGM